MKTCTACQQFLPLDDFYPIYRKDRQRLVYTPRCKACISVEGKARHAVKIAARPPKPPKPVLTHKTCILCNQYLPLEAFRRKHAKCIECYIVFRGKTRKRLPASLESAFLQYVTPGNPDECWLWNGYRTPEGYGQFGFGGHGNKHHAHRVAYELYNNTKIPLSLVACHTCDNPPCINPHHIFIGTSKDNNVDSALKGRRTFIGTDRKRPHAKLTIPQIYAIKQIAYEGNPQKVVSWYGISYGHVYSIWSGDSWPDIENLYRQWVTENT